MKHQWEETLCLLPIPLPEVTAALLQKFNGIFIYQGMFWTKNELVAMKWSSLRGWPFPLSEKPPCRKGKGVFISVFPVLLHTFCGYFLSETKLLGNLLGHQSLVFQEFLEREHQRLDTLFHALFHATLHAFFPYTLA